MNADERASMGAIHELSRRALDSLPVTDVTYYHLASTQPLVDDLLYHLVNQVERGDPVLLVGGTSLLAQSILAAGYDLHLWRFGDTLLTDDLEQRVRGQLTSAMLADGCLPAGDRQFAAMMLPLVFDQVRASPAHLLRALQGRLRRGGVLIVACRNLSSLGRRWRAVRGRPHLPGWHAPNSAPAIHWPAPSTARPYTLPELLDCAGAAGLRPIVSVYSMGQGAANGAAPPGLGRYLMTQATRVAQAALPSLRDYVVIALERDMTAAAADGQEDDLAGEAVYPFVSVVLPTHNRSVLLRDSFSGLLQQTYPADRFEVVLINDNSSDDTEEVAASLIARAPFAVQYVRTEGLGATAARNLGMRMARGEIVAHLDDDNRPVPGWIEEAVLGFRDGVAIVGGPVIPKPEQFVFFCSFTANYRQERGIFPTSNVFYRRDLALAEGGFDESFGRSLMGRPVWGWDSDLAWRLRRRGYRSRFRRGVVAYQEVVRQRPRDWLAEGWRMVVLPATVKRVPELGRYLLVHRLFADEATFRFDLALAGSLLAALLRRRLPLVLTLPYLVLLGRAVGPFRLLPHRWPRIALRAGLLMARHGLTFLALLVGSVHSRRVVL